MNFGKSERTRKFEGVIAPHIPAAYNLARWILHNEQNAEDVLQEACLRAFRHLDGLRGENSRAWLLAIVRNASYTWIEQNRAAALNVQLDVSEAVGDAGDPESLLHRAIDLRILREEMEKIPVEFREVIVLRDLEGFSYKEIAAIARIPMGTVMSRLARGREHLLKRLSVQEIGKGSTL